MTKEEAIRIISGYEVYGCGYCLQGGDEVEEALKLAVDALKELPTVDAIPVEWIEQYGRANWYDFGTKYNAITRMLEEWKRKEE